MGSRCLVRQYIVYVLRCVFTTQTPLSPRSGLQEALCRTCPHRTVGFFFPLGTVGDININVNPILCTPVIGSRAGRRNGRDRFLTFTAFGVRGCFLLTEGFLRHCHLFCLELSYSWASILSCSQILHTESSYPESVTDTDGRGHKRGVVGCVWEQKASRAARSASLLFGNCIPILSGYKGSNQAPKGSARPSVGRFRSDLHVLHDVKDMTGLWDSRPGM